MRDDTAVNFDWGYGAPAPGLPVDYFSVRWTRTLELQGGSYQFFAESDDGVRVWVDGQLIIDQWHNATGSTYSTTISLSSGVHEVRVEYYEATQIAKVRVWWVLGGGFPCNGKVNITRIRISTVHQLCAK